MARGSLNVVLKYDPVVTNNLKLKVKMATDAARGMIFLHLHNPPIIHRDLKSLNLLVDQSYTVKVADFGISDMLENEATMTAKSGTINWMPPEVFQGFTYTTKSDVFSYGMVMWEILTNEQPYSKLNQFQILRLLDRGERPAIPPGSDTTYIKIMADCWAEKPDDRPPFTEILDRLLKYDQTIAGSNDFKI